MVRRRSPPDPRYASIRVDNNFFDDSIEPSERAAADRLMELAGDLIISIAIPHTVRSELDNSRTPAKTRERAAQLPFTYDTGMGNLSRCRLVQSVIRGNAQAGKHDADAAHLYDSALWQCSYFVTCDKRLLKKDIEVSKVIDDLWIVTPSQLVDIYDDFSLNVPMEY